MAVLDKTRGKEKINIFFPITTSIEEERLPRIVNMPNNADKKPPKICPISKRRRLPPE